MKNITKLVLFSALSSNAALAHFVVGGSLGMNNTQIRSNDGDGTYGNPVYGGVGVNLEAGYRWMLKSNYHMTLDAFIDFNDYNNRYGFVSENDSLHSKQSQAYTFGVQTRMIHYMEHIRPYLIAGVGFMDMRINTGLDNGFVSESKQKMLFAVKLGFGAEREITKNLSGFAEFAYTFATEELKHEGFTATPTVYGVRLGARYYFGPAS